MEKTASLREIFAKNLRNNRRRCGFSQEKLAEKIKISTQYLAMMEIARKFPTAEVLERIAMAMDIKVYELFLIEHSPREELDLLRQEILQDINNSFDDKIHQSIVFNIENVVKMSVKQAVASELKNLIKK